MSEEREAEPGRERPRTAADRRARRSDATPAGSGGTRSRGTAVREGGRQGKGSLPSRFVRFLREVVAELRKVIWPTRKELITYTAVVVVFVAVVLTVVGLLDFAFAKAVLWVFGNKTIPANDQ